MVRIYTKKGDDGTTSLWYGGRIPKDDLHTEAYGTLDEATSALGLARAKCEADRLEDGVSRITDEMADALDAEIDRYLEGVDLPPQFTIPGGTQLSAQLDVARAVLRRAERRVVVLKESGGLASESILRFLNRASDLLFAMARATDEDSPARFEGRGKG